MHSRTVKTSFFLLLLALGFLLVRPALAANGTQSLFQLPEDLEEVKQIIRKILEILPQALKEAWGEAMKIFKQVFIWFKKIWAKYIEQRVRVLWEFLKYQIRMRKALFKQEFKKEFEELKQEIKNIFKK